MQQSSVPQFKEEGFHFGAGVLVAGLGGGGNSGGENRLGFAGARFAGEKLSVHEIGRDVGGIAVKEGPEMGVRCSGVAVVHAFHRKAVTGEGVVGFLSDELFEQLPAGFLLVGHKLFRIIRKKE